MSRAGLPILTYHAIDGGRGVIATDPAWFARTMAALASAGFHAVDLDDWIARGRPEVDRGFAITFDDGLGSIRRAADTLARHRFRATAFLVTGRMGDDNGWPGQPARIPRAPLLAWSDLADLQAAGFRFAAHTRSHPRLDRCDAPALDAELRSSREAIEDRLGTPCRLLAYPYGVAPARVRLAAARHFAAGFGTRLDYASQNEDIYLINRIDSYYLRSGAAVRDLINGRWRARLRVRRAMRAVRRAGDLLEAGQPGSVRFHRPSARDGDD